jgi:hypothetical protein
MLRIPRLFGLSLIALLVSAVLFLPFPSVAYWQRVTQDAAHGVIFAGVAIVLLALQRHGATPRRRSVRDYGTAFAVAVALGAGSELLQLLLPDRQVSLGDVLHDAAGAAFGLAAVALAERRGATPSPPLGPLVAVLLGAVTVLAWEPLRCARAYAERAAAFPTLTPMGTLADAAFVAARDATLEHAALPPAWRLPDEPAALKLQFEPGARPALELVEAMADWRGHRILAVDVTNPGPGEASFTLRILDDVHDWSHEDRLNLPVQIPAGTRTTVRVAVPVIEAAPARRLMDLAHIANVMLFATQPLQGTELYVSRIRLED